MSVVLCDADGVLFDTEALARRIFEALGCAGFDPCAWDFGVSKLHPHTRAAFWRQFGAQGSCASVPPYPGAQSFLDSLRDRHTVYVVTAPMDGSRTWAYERARALNQHFYLHSHSVVFAHAKHAVYGDYLIDDKPENVSAFARAWPHARGVLFDQAYNREAAPHDRVLRADSYAAVLEYVK